MLIIKLLIFILLFSLVSSAKTFELSDLEKVTALTNYFAEKALYVEKPNFPSKVLKPIVPKAKKLVKGKYEKTTIFNARVAKEKMKRQKLIKLLEFEYYKNAKKYNIEVKRLTDAYNNKVSKKRKHIKSSTLNAMQKAYSIVYGRPYLENSLKYDADSEMFYGAIKSSKGSFQEKISFHIPIDKAEEFEKNLKSVKPKLEFKYVNSKLILSKITLDSEFKIYVAMLNESNYKPKEISVAINNGSLNLPSAKLLSTSLDIDSSAYSLGEINYSKDPEIAKLQKEKYLLEKDARDKKQSLARKEKLRQQKQALEAQIALLQDTKGGADDLASLLQNSKAQKVDSKKWLFIIGIENYEYTAPVAYSANSAKQFKNVMQKRLGISEKNTRVLINKNATSGQIRYNLKDIVAHVKKGDIIYFYYSGHGIPVPSQKNAPYLLAQDMSPEYVADDERFKLQNIYKALSKSKASKIVAFVDSCFSGGTDNQALLKGVAATRIKPKKVTFDKSKMLVISAGSGTEYSNKYDAKSNRLFSYYLMRGLINNNSNMQRLYDYVKSNVQEKSYEMGASYEQVPVYSGNIELKL